MTQSTLTVAPSPSLEQDEFFHDRPEILSEVQALLDDREIIASANSTGDYYFDTKIRKKTILMVGLGKNVRGNLQYILNELNGSDLYKGFRIYVRTSEETDEIVKKYIEDNHWLRTTTVLNDKEYRYVMESVQFYLTEVFFPDTWTKRPGQISINIWHGTPLKKLGLAKNSKTCHRGGNTQKNFIEADYLLYPNEYTKKNMLESYKVSELMNGQTLMLGYPRTGGMLAAQAENQEELRNLLAPNGEKIYAYMPTFKDYLKNEVVVKQSKDLLDYLEANLRDDQLLYVNLHHKVSDSIDYSGYKRIKKFPPNIDSYRLLSVTEALITDYSSVFFDYLALRKQIILFMEDYKVYKKKRGVYMDLSDLPFDKAITKEEILEAINRGKTYNDDAVYQEFCQYDSSENAKKLCQIFLNDLSGLDLQPIPKKIKHKVLVYSERMQPGHMTKQLHELTKIYDKQENEIFLSCCIDAVNQNTASAYPMLFENSVIGTGRDPHLTGKGKVLKTLYLEHEISLDEAMKYLKYDYALMPLRMYGHADFDRLVIYDVLDPELLFGLSQMQVPKVMIITDDMIREIESENEELKAAIQYTIKNCEQVYTESEFNREFAEELFEIPLTAIHNTKELCQIVLDSDPISKFSQLKNSFRSVTGECLSKLNDMLDK